MDIRSYIASGILEAYLFGELTLEESGDVERMLREYPELREELHRIEKDLETVGQAGAINPPAFVKENILKQISASDSTIEIGVPRKKNTDYWPWVAAACFIVAVASSLIAFNYRAKYLNTSEELAVIRESNARIASDYNQVNDRLDELSEQITITSNAQFQRIALEGTESNEDNRADVFWNPETQQTYIKISRLKQIASDQQYQLWAIVDGQPVDAGVFSETDFIELKSVENADAFAITVEPQGGSSSPTLSTMLVVGAVSA